MMAFSASRILIVANWNDINVPSPPGDAANSDITINFGSGTRQISMSSSQPLNYRINSGSWIGYSTPFNINHGQTLGWQFAASGLVSSTLVTVTDATTGAVIDTFNVSAGS